MKSHKIKINISARYLSPEVIGRTGMTEVDCLAELVANSLDWNISRLDDKTPTNIIIEKGNDFIVTQKRLSTVKKFKTRGKDGRLANTIYVFFTCRK